MAVNSNSELQMVPSWSLSGLQLRFQIARFRTPAYSNSFMGQQHRVRAKRRRRKAYEERKRTAAAAQRRAAAKPRGKKTAPEATG